MSIAVTPRVREAWVRAAQLAVGLLLAWAALSKIGDIPSLAREIGHFQVLPAAGVNLLAIVLPWIELTTALSLLLGLRARAGAIVATGLMTVFTAVVALAVVRGLDVECGCFGTTFATRTGATKLLANAGMLALAVISIPWARPGKA